MTRTRAHVIRTIGLFVEMAGVVAVYAGRDNPAPIGLRFPGFSGVLPLSWLVFGVGFIIWFTGIVLVFRSR
jgi:hypothetical protein